MLWIFLLQLELCGSHFFYVMNAILDFILNTMSKNISRNTTMSGVLIKNSKILMYVAL